MKDIILLITSGWDKSLDSVIEILKKKKVKFFRFDTETFPGTVSIGVEFFGPEINGLLECGGASIEIEQIKSCWYRHVSPSGLLGNVTKNYLKFIQGESKTALWSLYTCLDVFWMNHPLFGSRLLGNNKLFQIKSAAGVGLKVPETIISNNPEKLVYFCRAHGGELAVKLLSGHVFLPKGSKDSMCVYTQLVSENDLISNFQAIQMAPVLAQEYIRKYLELRITIVGQKIFTCAIYSQNSDRTLHDWRRYDFSKVKHEIFDLPKGIKEKLLKFMTVCNLQFGAIDMILTPDDEYIFLEVNPQGQWGWIEELTGLPISNEIAEILISPPKT